MYPIFSGEAVNSNHVLLDVSISSLKCQQGLVLPGAQSAEDQAHESCHLTLQIPVVIFLTAALLYLNISNSRD